MKHYEPAKQFVLLLPLLLITISSYSFAGELALPSNKRWIVVASRQTIEEAKLVEESYKPKFKDTSIFSSTNGWYAITIGIYDYPKDKSTLSNFILNGIIPEDSRFASGKDFLIINKNSANKIPEARSQSFGEVCVKKAVPGAVAGAVGGAIADCLLAGCANTIIAILTGIVSGGTTGCIKGVLE